MARKVYEENNIRAIAEKIREKTGTTKTYTTEEMPQGIEEVYSAGLSGGGYEEGFEDGKKSEYDAFWDAYQQGGVRKNYATAFAGYGWTESTFKPKYDIVPTEAYMMFRQTPMEVDLVEYLNSIGVILNLSNATNTQYLFNFAAFTRIGVVDVRASTNSVPLDSCFSNCKNLVTVDKIYIKTGKSGEFSNNTFLNCTALENITLEGEITANGLNLQWSGKLSKASIENVISCLSATTSGLTVTFSKTAVNTAFETSSGAGDGSTSTEWKALVATKSNWTISLV